MMRSALAVVLVASLAGCKTDAPSSGSGFASPTAPAVATAGDPGPAPAAAPVEPSPGAAPSVAGPMERLLDQLAKEKAERPGSEPSVETVLAAIDKAGVRFDEQRQVLAATVGARYCFRAGTKDGLNVVVCEHASRADAETSARYVSEKYPQLSASRTFAIKGTTSIQVLDRPDQPLADARRRIDGALATLATP